jgi:hypothetical protein
MLGVFVYIFEFLLKAKLYMNIPDKKSSQNSEQTLSFLIISPFHI